jgi:hypothetical protein
MRTADGRRRSLLAERHISALRAYHTGLVAETYRHLKVLAAMAEQIDILRRRQTTPREKLGAVQATCRQLRALETLKRPWVETYRDFRRSLRRARALFARVALDRQSRLEDDTDRV